MKRELRISPAAEADLAEAFEYYFNQEPGLEIEFLDCVSRGFARIVETPFAFPLARGSIVRRAQINRFPFTLVFVVREDHVWVYSIFHNSRNPKIWRNRVD